MDALKIRVTITDGNNPGDDPFYCAEWIERAYNNNIIGCPCGSEPNTLDGCVKDLVERTNRESKTDFKAADFKVEISDERTTKGDQVKRAAKEWAERLQKIEDRVAAVEGLTLGYIGNCESWGDDRRWYIWVDLVAEDSGNRANIWSAESATFDRRDYARALVSISHYEKGFKAALAQIEKQRVDQVLDTMEKFKDNSEVKHNG